MSKKKLVPLMWLLCFILMVSLVVFISCPEHSVPDFKFGDIGPSCGYVFYDKVSYSNEWRYLEAASTDIPYNLLDYSHIFGYYRSSPMCPSLLVGTSTEIGTGKANTTAQVVAMGSSAYVSKNSGTTTTTADYAAKICENFVVGVFDDRFLPSRDEMNQIYINLYKKGSGGFLVAAPTGFPQRTMISTGFFKSSPMDFQSTMDVRFTTVGTLQTGYVL